MTVYVGNHYKNGDVVYLYYYNSESNQVEAISRSGHVVKDGYVTYVITHCSDYFLARETPEQLGIKVEPESKPENKPGNSGVSAPAQNPAENIGPQTAVMALSPQTGDTGNGMLKVVIAAMGILCSIFLFAVKRKWTPV